MTFLALLLAPVAVCIFTFLKFRETVTWKEFALQFGGSILVVSLGLFIAQCSSVRDTEIWSGKVTRKDHGSESCCHCQQICSTCTDAKGNSYECNCYEDCDHFQDYWWRVQTTLGAITIDDCEPSRGDVPMAWQAARIGDPVSSKRTYKNYLLADPDSLIRKETNNPFVARVPAFPKRIYNFYYLDHVITDKVKIPAGWQRTMREANADLGAKRQVHIVVLLTSVQDPTYAQAVEAKWLYGPKNSLTVVMGVKGREVSWARVVSISRVEELKVMLRDDLIGKAIDGPEVPALIRRHVSERFVRTPMAEYEYLADAASPSGWVLFFLFVLGLGVSIGLGVWMHREDVFGEERMKRFGYRRF